MAITNKQLGMALFGFGLFFAVTFLIGGGVVTSTSGAYWTVVFFASSIVSLLLFGPILYRKVLAERSNQNQPSAPSRNRGRFSFAILLIFPLCFVASRWFIASPLFATSVGTHLFVSLMGVCLSLFVPLGFAMMRCDAHKPGAA